MYGNDAHFFCQARLFSFLKSDIFVEEKKREKMTSTFDVDAEDGLQEDYYAMLNVSRDVSRRDGCGGVIETRCRRRRRRSIARFVSSVASFIRIDMVTRNSNAMPKHTSRGCREHMMVGW